MAQDSLTHFTMGDIRQDEEKWFKFFTKRSLLTCLAGALPGYAIFAITGAFLPGIVGGILWLALEIFLFIMTTVRLNVEDHHEDGGGLFLYEIFLRKLFRKIGRVYYIKMNAEDEDEEDED